MCRSNSYHVYDNSLAMPEETTLGKTALSTNFYIGEDNLVERERSYTVPASLVAPVSFRDISLAVPAEPAKYDSMVIHGMGKSSGLLTEL